MQTKTIAAALALALAASAAHAAVTFTPYGAGSTTPAGYTVVTQFSGGPPPTDLAPGFALSGTGQFVTGNSIDNWAAPALSGSSFDTGQYLAVLTGESETLTVAPGVTKLSVYVGSLDSYNDLDFTFSGPGVSYTGAELASMSGAVDSGDQSAGSSNGLFTFTFDKPIDSVTFGSTGNSFEIAAIGASAAGGVPEPATWSMLLTGFFGIGGLLRRRGTRLAAA